MRHDTRQFWDRVARRYADMAIRHPDAFEQTLARTRAQLTPQDRVLELGCGTGMVAVRLAPGVRAYVASDYSAEMIAIARERANAAGLETLQLCLGGPGDGTLPEGPFDAALAFNLLHLLPDRRAALHEIADCLRPGGLFISKTPCLAGVYRVLHPLLLTLRMFGKAPAFHFLSPARLERDIAEAGFDIVQTADDPNRPPRRFIMARKR